MSKQIDKALSLIKSNDKISLGGGNHIKMLAKAVKDSQLENISICSPSEATISYCRELGLNIDQSIANIDIGFDGCDSVDKSLQALKSNGAIFTYEMRNAILSKRFVILTGDAHYADELSVEVPLTLEVIDASLPLVRQIANQYNLKIKVREASNYMGYTRTRDGNLIIDCFSSDWHEIHQINLDLVSLPGVLGSSLFTNLITDVLIESETGEINCVRKEK